MTIGTNIFLHTYLFVLISDWIKKDFTCFLWADFVLIFFALVRLFRKNFFVSLKGQPSSYAKAVVHGIIIFYNNIDFKLFLFNLEFE